MPQLADSAGNLLKLAQHQFGQLSHADKRLFDAAARHEVADFRVETNELNQSEFADQWGIDRTLKADRLIWLLTTPNVSDRLGFRGLRITGAKIKGEFNLEYATVPAPLLFDTCVFTNPLILQNAQFKALTLTQTHVPGIEASEMRVAGSVSLCDGFVASGCVNLTGARIEGRLACTGGQFNNSNGDAIDATDATVASSVFLAYGFKARGQVILRRASIGGQLNCNGGEFYNEGKTAINANTAVINTTVPLSDGFKARGEVILRGASIRGQLACDGGEFYNKGKTAINADNATVATSVILRDGFTAEGAVNLRGISIGGQLDCSGGKFSNEGKIALLLDAATIAADVFLRNGFKAEGEVILRRASIGGQLSCKHGEFNNKEGTAITLETAAIAAQIFLCDGFKATGEVNLRGASIGEQLNCTGGEFNNGSKTAIVLDAAKIGASVFLRDGFKATGEINLCGISITGKLDCSGGEFNNQEGAAIVLDAATVSSDVYLSGGFKAWGGVNLRGMSIGGQLDCSGGEFNNEGKTAITLDAAKAAADIFIGDGFKARGEVNLHRTSIGGTLYCIGGSFLNKEGVALYAESTVIDGSVILGGKSRDGNSLFYAEGFVILFNATVGNRFELRSIEHISESMKLGLQFTKANTFSFYDRQAEETWIKHMKSGQLRLNGFVYSSINTTGDAIRDQSLLRWLRLQIAKDAEPGSDNGFALQPYEQLAMVLKAQGHQESAIKVLIAKEEDRRRYGGLNGWGKAWNKFLGLTIAHGYRPQQALLYSLLIILLGWGVFGMGKGLMVQTSDSPKSYAVFDSLAYSFDTFTPVIDLRQENAWLPDASKGQEVPLLLFKARQGELLRYYYWFQIVAGWILTSLWVAGFTGLVRSRN